MLKTIIGAFAGTIIGLVIGIAGGALFWDAHPYDKALGSQDVQGMAKGFTAIALTVLGGGFGFIAGAVTALVLHVRHARKGALHH